VSRTHAWILAPALALAGCSEAPVERTLQIVTGHESDAFSKDPAVTAIHIEAKSVNGTTFSADTTPGGSFDLGDVPEDEPLVVEVSGTSADGSVVVRGRSLTGILPGGFASPNIPVFVQRIGTWARPPGELERAHVDAPVAVIGEQYLMSSGGSGAAGANGAADAKLSDFYDLLTWNGGAATDAMPHVARSIVGRPNGMLLIGEDGATFVDTTGTDYEVSWPAPTGSFADIAGGRVVESPDGSSYVVGPTRTSTPSQTVLVVGSDFALSVLKTTVARKGAASAWAPSVGLVVVAGNASGSGLEVLSEGGSAFAARDFAADATEGAAAVVVDEGTMALVGGIDAG